MVELVRRPVSSSLLNRCTTDQSGQIGKCSTLRLNRQGTIWCSLVEDLFLLFFSTGAQPMKLDKLGSVLPCGLTDKVLYGVAW